MSRKEARQLVGHATDHGWVNEGIDGTGHYTLLWPESNERVSIPSSPSGWRALRDARRDLERICGPLPGGTQHRKTTLKRAPMKPGRANPNGPSKQLRDAVHQRSGNRCECCGTPLNDINYGGIHHRRNKSQGVINTLSNCIDTCITCHGFVTRNPRAARVDGWHVNATEDPRHVPHTYPERGPVFLRDTGEIHDTTTRAA